MKTEELQTIAQAAAQALGTGSGMALGKVSRGRTHCNIRQPWPSDNLMRWDQQ